MVSTAFTHRSSPSPVTFSTSTTTLSRSPRWPHIPGQSSVFTSSFSLYPYQIHRTRTQKRPGERDVNEIGGSKRSRRESPAGDWRDVHLREKERDRPRDYDKRSSRRREDEYRGSRRGHGRDRDYRRKRSSGSDSRSRSRSVNGAGRSNPAPPVPVGDDEKEEGEISPRLSAKSLPVAGASSRNGLSPRTDRRRGEYSRRSRSRSRSTAAARSKSPHRSTLKRNDKDRAKDIEMRDPITPQQEVEEQESEEEKSIEEKLAERRRKRAEILARHASGQSSINPPQTPSVPVSETLAKVTVRDVSVDTTGDFAASRRESASPPPPSALDQFALAKEDEEQTDVQPILAAPAEPQGETGQLNAADYDPSLDRREDEKKRFGVEPAAPQLAESKTMETMVIDDEEEEEEVEVTDDEGEEEVDDMFALAFGDEEEVKAPKSKKVVKRKVKKAAPLMQHPSLMVDSAADHEGYYTVILGEYLDGGRYQVFSSLGKGMFANVVRARVLKEEGDVEVTGTPREVAVKIIRCQESMYKAGIKEAQILQKLRTLDMEDKKHVVKLERTFEHRGHLCLVFESMSMNLREVVKRFGKDVGLNIRAVRAYSHQLFLSLSLLRKANIMHADIKPDNILVNEQKTMLKLCDLGSASDASENDITPYLVSRFYRAPEIILGVPYDPSLDIWSVGCTLYELYTGKILFPGRSNSHMLLLMMELKGRFNNKMIKKAKFGEKYFDSLGNFESVEKDRITGQDVVKTISVSTRPVKDLRNRVLGGPGEQARMKEEEVRMLTNFVDLLEKCLVLDPGRRMTPREALAHPFIRG